jgi:ribose transport system ATP-binding protein
MTAEITATAAVTSEVILELRSLRKTFPGVLALDDVDFDVRRGEVHALLGANGAGKSTLIKIVAGLYRADAGEIRIDGRPVELADTQTARALGVSVIYQDFALVQHLSVAESLFLGPHQRLSEPTWWWRRQQTRNRLRL